ncbi:MAG: hypothetical protein ACI33S_00920 [Bacilli bacterium]
MASNGNANNGVEESSNNNISSSSTTGSNPVGFSGALKPNKADIDAINKRGTNGVEHSKTFRKNNNLEKQRVRTSELDNDGLEDKTNSKIESKSSNTKTDNKGKGEKSKSKNSSVVDIVSKKTGLKSKLLKLKLKLIILGIVLSFFVIIFIISYFIAAYDALLNSISSFFGISETESEESLLKNEKYYIDPETGEEYNTDELVEMLKEDEQCKTTFFNGLSDWLDMFDGTIDSFCTYTRYVKKSIEKLEKKYPTLHMDRALVLSGIFYGYAAQPNYSEYIDSYNAPYTISAAEHYESLMDMLKSGTLTVDDLDDMINNAVANHTHPYYEWQVEDIYDRKGKLIESVGKCIKQEQQDVKYSLLRWQMFLRFGDSTVKTYDKLMIRKKAWASSDVECNGTVDDATLLAKISASGAPKNTIDNSVRVAQKYLQEYEDPPNMNLFEQKAEIEGYEKDVFESYNYKDISVNFDYVNGFAYNRFPYFKRAYESNMTELYYDEAITPKVIETLILNSEEKKTVMNDILNFEDQDNPLAYSNFGTMWSSVGGAYCADYVAVPFNQIEVIIKDCDGREIGKTSFKDYIMGVAYGEVSDRHDDYVKSEMVAAISYSLARRGNYTKVPTITMKSGNCDQVYCPMNSGCSSNKSNLDCGGFSCTSYYPGTGYTMYHGAAGDALIQKYARLYDEASQFLLVKDGAVYSAGYVSTVQNKWYEMAKSGMSFTQIMQETYGPDGAELVQCINIDDSNNSSTIADNSMGNGPSTDSVTIKKVGNTISEKYDKLSPDLGKFYGYSYNDDPVGRDITINPDWINANIITINTTWNTSYRVNTQAKYNFELAYKNIGNILNNGVKLSDGNICKYTIDDLQGGTTFEQRKSSSGLFSEASYGIVQSWNYNKVYTINNKVYKPYSKGSTISDYNEFVEALGREEDCRNINYILYKYAYEPAGFVWGKNSDNYDSSLFKINY